MISISAPALSKLTVAAIIVAGLALSGCGRKGGLDLPPSAGPQTEAQSGQPPVPESADQKGRALFNPAATDSTLPAPQGERRRFVLDPLLD